MQHFYSLQADPASAGTLTLVLCIRALPGSPLCQRPYEALTFQLHEFPLQLLLHTPVWPLYEVWLGRAGNFIHL